MVLKVIKVKDYDEMGEKACELMIDRIKQIQDPVLGLATGSTPEGLYQRLIEKYKQKEISFQNVTTFNLDEYVGVEKDNPSSYYYFMQEKLLKHVDIQPERAHIQNSLAADLEKECEEYEQMIADHGHIDLQLLGIGVNGHIGFNEPGTPFSSRTRVARLKESTRQVNARFFDSVDDVPKEALTMGIKTIMESKEIILLISGENKADAVARLVNGEVSEDIPVSVLKNHKYVTVIADEAALSKTE